MPTTVVNRNLESVEGIYIGRGTKWGNKWSHKKGFTLAEFHVDSREEAIEKYKEWLLNGEGQYLLKHLYELKNKVLICSCSPLPCHGHILAELADTLPERKEPKFTVDKLLGSRK